MGGRTEAGVGVGVGPPDVVHLTPGCPGSRSICKVVGETGVPVKLFSSAPSWAPNSIFKEAGSEHGSDTSRLSYFPPPLATPAAIASAHREGGACP